MSLIKFFDIDIEKAKKRSEERRQERLELRMKLREEKENQKIMYLDKWYIQKEVIKRKMSQTNKEETLKAMIIDCLSKKAHMSATEIYRTSEKYKPYLDFGKSPTYKKLYKTLKDMVKEGKLLERHKNINTPISTLDFTLKK